MAIAYNIAKHATGFPSKVLASQGGKHIFNIQIETDGGIDNGTFVGKGDFVSLDLYKETAPTSFSGKVVAKAANGNFYVEVVSASNALFVYTVPMIAEDWTKRFQSESNFYNAKGDVARCYELAEGDIVEISADGFTGVPSVGTSVSLSGNKLAPATSI